MGRKAGIGLKYFYVNIAVGVDDPFSDGEFTSNQQRHQRCGGTGKITGEHQLSNL